MDRAESALQFISPVDRETWVMAGMALQSEYGDAARDLWMTWSRQAESFRELDARSVWKSFKGTGISIASLLHEAKQAGWRDEGFQRPTPDQIQAQRVAAAERASEEGRQRARLASAAAKKADWILSQCKHERHAYLDSKGFTELEGLVWWPDETTNLLCIPMYVAGKLVGVQMIDRDGSKKYLSNQITSMAEYVFDCNSIGATEWWIEGYGSALSLRACLHALKARYRIHVTYSAGNLQRMAHSGYVVADNDASGVGEVAAIATGLPYWMPERSGQDINDVHQAMGTFRASQVLGKWIRATKEAKAA